MQTFLNSLRGSVTSAFSVAIVAIAMTAATAPAAANDTPQFTNATLNGSYGFWFEGQEFSAVIGGLSPIAGIARFEFDGAGNAAIERVTIRPSPAGGVTTPADGREALTATYSVEPTGKVDIAIDGDPEFYACVLKDDRGYEFGCILSAENRVTGPFDPDGGDVATYQGALAAFEASGVRQNRRRDFSERQLRGLYTFLESNQDGTPDGLFPAISIAQFNFDGVGSSFAPIGSIGYLFGQPVGELPPTTPQTSPVTYSVDSEGFATIGGPFVDPFGAPIGGSFELTCVLARRGKIGACLTTQFTPAGAPPEIDVPSIGVSMIERVKFGAGDDD